jgi:hypothetical protein
LVVFKKTTVKLVGSTLGNGGDIAHPTELRRIVDLADANFRDRPERRKQLGRCSIRSDIHSADAIDADGQHAGLGTCDGEGSAVIDLHAHLSREC